jgi:BirA family biotin operon repressor/biotin-[acetyl-CoA-carboxylase] ligase
MEGKVMREKILQLLRKEKDYVSGEEIGRILGISRSAIWKYVNGLREEGYNITSVPRLGYRLDDIPDLLLPEEVKDGLNTTLLGKNIVYFKEIDSTNNKCKNLGQMGSEEGTVVVAEAQKSGRGRIGRYWNSPSGMGIWMSVLLRPQISPMEAPKVTLLAAVAVTSAIRKCTGIDVGIKWPNDLMVEGKKVCGILTEMSAEMDSVNYIVLGIGLNVNIPLHQFPAEVQETATSLMEVKGGKISRKLLLQEIIRQLEKYYFRWQKEGIAPILKEWRRYSMVLNSPVSIIERDQRWEGIALDILESGALIVKLMDGTIREFSVGEVSLRPGNG